MGILQVTQACEQRGMHFMHYEPSTLSPLCDASTAFSYGLVHAVRRLVIGLMRRREGPDREGYAMAPLCAKRKDE